MHRTSTCGRTSASAAVGTQYSVFPRSGPGSTALSPQIARSRSRPRATLPLWCAAGVRAGAPDVDPRWSHLVQAQAAVAQWSPSPGDGVGCVLAPVLGIIPPPRQHLSLGTAACSGRRARTARSNAYSCPPTLMPHRALPAVPVRGPSNARSAAPFSCSRRLPWADLLRRVFADDVPQCFCGERRASSPS